MTAAAAALLMAPVAAFALSVVPLVIGIWSTRLYVEYSPVYRDVVCKFDGKPELDGLNFGPSLQAPVSAPNAALNASAAVVQEDAPPPTAAPPGTASPPEDAEMVIKVRIRLQCENPNPYVISFMASTKGHSDAFIGVNRTLVKSVVDLEPSTLPRYGEGPLNTKVTITTSHAQLNALLPTILGPDPVPFMMTLAVNAWVDVRFFQQKWQVSQDFLKDCSLSIKDIADLAFGNPGGKISGLACGNSFSELPVPSVDDFSLVDVGFAFAAKDMVPEAVSQGELERDLGLGSGMAWGYGLFLLMVTCASCCLGYATRRRRREKESADATASAQPGHTQTTEPEPAPAQALAAAAAAAPTTRVEESV